VKFLGTSAGVIIINILIIIAAMKNKFPQGIKTGEKSSLIPSGRYFKNNQTGEFQQEFITQSQTLLLESDPIGPKSKASLVIFFGIMIVLIAIMMIISGVQFYFLPIPIPYIPNY
jgi:hypothetical protein